jgi:addiction module RelE/StbE family toxin
MKRHSINILPQAEDDLQEILDFIATDKVSAAHNMADRFEKALERLSQNPEVGRKTREERLRLLGYRYVIVGNYLIFYRIQPDGIFLYRVLHGARDYATII